jgi:hypothetical protein
MASSSKQIDILVSVDDKHLDQIHSVSKRLRSKGMAVTEVLEISGVITGSAQPESLAALRNVPGVAAVEPDQHFTTSS